MNKISMNYFIFISIIFCTLSSFTVMANTSSQGIKVITNKGGGHGEKLIHSSRKRSFAGDYYRVSQLTITDGVREGDPWNVTGKRINTFETDSFEKLYLHVEFLDTYRDFTTTLRFKDANENLGYEQSFNIEGGYDEWRCYIYMWYPLGHISSQEIVGELLIDGRYVNSTSAWRVGKLYKSYTVDIESNFNEGDNLLPNFGFFNLVSAGDLKMILKQNGLVVSESGVTNVSLSPFEHNNYHDWNPAIYGLQPGNYSVEFLSHFDGRDWETITTKSINVKACTVYYRDSDGDGYGNPSQSKKSCTPLSGYVTNNRDCNDNDSKIYPGASEACDGKDNDCDNTIDEGVKNACGKCGPVPKEICDGKDNDCDGSIDEGVKNACGQCGSVPVEVCDGKDNDCDGSIDEGVKNACGKCGPVPVEVCDAIDNDCDGAVDEGVKNACGKCGPVPKEICDGIDNDCDGVVDEDVKNACGKCGPVPEEICDGKDNDCDGSIDEGVANACGTCGPVPKEICDGIDNDCDGSIDEGVKNACGKCGPVPEEICDGKDNDCDGSIDEGVANACGTCGPVPKEICDGIDNDCDGVVDEDVKNACGKCGPVPKEICDGIDNNCDGSIDEGVKNACGECGAVPDEVCDGKDNDCDGSIDENVTNACGECGPVPDEICDNKDNDCDGLIDETCPAVLNSFSINSDALTTNNRSVILNISADNHPTFYMASENDLFSEATWKEFSETPSFVLTEGFGDKTIYLKLKNSVGESRAISDTINVLPDSCIVSGNIVYNGGKSGLLIIEGFTVDDSSFEYPVTIGKTLDWKSDDTQKSFQLILPTGIYIVRAFIDTNNNDTPDMSEPQGICEISELCGRSDCEIALTTKAIKGDVNQDGIINMLDIKDAFLFYIGIKVPDEQQFAASDIYPFSSGDGNLTIDDVKTIFQLYIGLLAIPE